MSNKADLLLRIYTVMRQEPQDWVFGATKQVEHMSRVFPPTSRLDDVVSLLSKLSAKIQLATPISGSRVVDMYSDYLYEILINKPGQAALRYLPTEVLSGEETCRTTSYVSYLLPGRDWTLAVDNVNELLQETSENRDHSIPNTANIAGRTYPVGLSSRPIEGTSFTWIRLVTGSSPPGPVIDTNLEEYRKNIRKFLVR